MLVVGQKLWFVSSNRTWNPLHQIKPGQEVEITKIGNKWVTISSARDHRFDKADPSMTIDGKGFSSPGRCFLTQEEFETKRKTQIVWDELRKLISNHYSYPIGTTIDDILKATEILGLNKITPHD